MSACAVAGGAVARLGNIEQSEHASDERVRNEATARRVFLNEQQHGRVCPHCNARVQLDLFSYHVMMLHPDA